MAHGWNFDRTYRAMRIGINIIVLDNTNTQLKEFVKYLLPARFYHYDICLLEPDVDWKYDVQACFEKNTHGVPRETIERMLARFESTDKLVKYLGIEDEQAKYTRILSQTRLQF